MAASVCMTVLLFLEAENRRKSPCTSTRLGGVVTAGMAIYDTSLSNDLSRYRNAVPPGGVHGSAAAVLRNQGRATPLPTLHGLDEPSGGFSGQASDIERHAEDYQTPGARTLRQAYRPELRGHRAHAGPRLLHDCRAGSGIWHYRQGPIEPGSRRFSAPSTPKARPINKAERPQPGPATCVAGPAGSSSTLVESASRAQKSSRPSASPTTVGVEPLRRCAAGIR